MFILLYVFLISLVCLSSLYYVYKHRLNNKIPLLSPIKLKLSIYNRLLSDTTTSCSVSGENNAPTILKKISSIIKAIPRERIPFIAPKNISFRKFINLIV